MSAGEQARLFALGVNHLTASVELRDRLLLDETRLTAFAEKMLQEKTVRELVVVSTCNRTEMYGVADSPEAARSQLEQAWCGERGVAAEALLGHDYFFTELDALRHLFRVIGSLDSMILGEVQIFGQVKDAYQRAAKRGWSNFYLNHIFQSGLHAGKRIHAETGIHEGAVSISYAAVELARKVLGELKGKTVGVVGAGEMGELAAQHLHKAGARRFLFFNRSRGSAEQLAAAFSGEVRLLSELSDHLSQCDIVVSATGAPEIVITREQVQGAARQRHGKPLFLIDIAAPRDIDPEAGNVGNTFLFTIDDLQNVIQENVELRRHAARNAEAIVAEETDKIAAWMQSLGIVPMVRALRGKYQDLVEKEIEKWAAGQSPETRQKLESLGRGLLNKFLHTPTTQLKLLGEQGDAQRASYYAGALFDLTEKDSEHA